MISLFSLLRSRLLLPVLVTLLLALLAQLLVALLLTRVTVGALEKQLAQRLQQDSAALSSALEQASGEVQTGLQALAGKTQGRLAEGLSTRLGEEQQQLRLLLEGGLQQSADDIAQLLAAVAPKAIWDNDVPALTELVRMAQRNSAVVFVVYLDAQGQRLTRHLNRQDYRVQTLLDKGEGRSPLDKVLQAAAQDKSIYLAQAEISPLGTVIGKVLVGVSTANVDDSLEALDQRFASLIEGSGELVSSGLSGAAADSAATLAARLQAARDTAVNMTEGSRQTVQEAAAALRWRVAAGLLLVGGLLLFSVLIVLGWRVVSKLRLLIAALDDLAAGEGDLTRRIALQGQDEVGEMAAAVNRFVAKLQPIVREAGEVAGRTASEIIDLGQRSAVAEAATRRQSEEVAASRQALAGVGEEAALQSQLMGDAQQQVGAIRQLAHENAQIAQRVGALIEALVTRVEQGAVVIERLARQSEQIETVLHVIHGIAEQTNLLALNAAIEAARAGESGRGFAVVADEVRALASKTQQSTGDIQQHIVSLQQGARDAVAAIGEAGAQGEQGVLALRDSERLQQSIQRAVDEVHGAIEAAASAARQQGEGVLAVGGRVEVIHQEAQRAAEAVAQAAASGRMLAELARQLQGSLGQFKA